MKRTRLRRNTPIGHATFADALAARKANPPKRRKAIARKSARRIERESVFKPYVSWLHAFGATCVMCGTAVNVQGAHIAKSLGTGRKRGIAADMIRLCGTTTGRTGCHAMWDGPRTRGVFSTMTADQRESWSVVQRLLHWDAFADWVGVAIARKHEDAPALLGCEAAIAAHRAVVVAEAERRAA